MSEAVVKSRTKVRKPESFHLPDAKGWLFFYCVDQCRLGDPG